MCIDRTTLQELGCNGLHMKKKQMKIETERSDKMTTKEVARICGVADRNSEVQPRNRFRAWYTS